MKYLLVFLVLITAPLTNGARPVPAAMAARLDLDASFDVMMGRTAVHVYVTAARWSDHARVAVHIEEPNPACGQEEGCRRLLSGDGRAIVPTADVVVGRDLRWAAVHASVPFTDDVSGRTFPIAVDLALHARDGFHPSAGSGDPGYVNAAAAGVVTSSRVTFVGPDQVSAAGSIVRGETW